MTSEFSLQLNALPADRFLGRADELDRLTGAVGHGLQGRPAALAIVGAAGCGKSELIRQALLRLLDSGAEILPVYIELPESGDAPAAERDAWFQLIYSLTRQIVASERRLSPLAPPLMGASPARLAQMAHGAGLGPWASALVEGLPPDHPGAGEEHWRGILRTRAQASGPALVIAVDGGSRHPRAAWVERILRALVRASIAEGCPLLFEADLIDVELWSESRQIETVELGGLDAGEGQALASWIGEKQESVAPEGAVAEVLPRLGGNPALIEGWMGCWSRLPKKLSATRRAEEAYLNLIEQGPQAARWRNRFEAAVPLELRSPALAMLAELGSRRQPGETRRAPLSTQAVLGRLGLASDRAEPVLKNLVRAGFLCISGEGHEAAPLPALADWIQMQAALGEGRRNRAEVRAEMLRRLLGERIETHRAAGAPAGVADLVSRFSLQIVPQVLFRYDQYHEALGEVRPERRRDEVMRSTRTQRLPEVIGVIPASLAREGRGAKRGESATEGANRISLYYAYAYREGIYQRSHEETWILGDFTASPTLTSLEVALFVEAARELERRFGPGRYVRCLFAGESVSPEAIERIAEERLFCAAAEQIGIIEECLGEKVARRAPAKSEEPEAAVAPKRVPVISIPTAPGTTVSRLALAARSENEIIAALMAEKIAGRCGLDAQGAGQVKMAVLEGCLNAIEHSANPEKEISIKFVERPSELEIFIENEGSHFDPGAVEDPDPRAKLKSAYKRGWGIKLMKEFMDEVVYERTGIGTRLRLIKRFGEPRQPAAKPKESPTPGRKSEAVE